MAEFRETDIRKLQYDYIKKNPGASFKILKNVFRMSEGNLRYHLHYLERKERIMIEKEGRDRCCFPTIGKRLSTHPGVELTLVQERMMDLIVNDPGIASDDLMLSSHQNRRSFEYNLRKLREMGLIRRSMKGTRPGYEALMDALILQEKFLETVKRFTEGHATKEELMDMVTRLERVKREKGLK
jgi:predicted transcriptional regulator